MQEKDARLTPAFLPALLLWSAKRDRAILGRTPSQKTESVLRMYRWAVALQHGQIYELVVCKAVIDQAMAEMDRITLVETNAPSKTQKERRAVADSLVRLGTMIEQAKARMDDIEFVMDRRLYA